MSSSNTEDVPSGPDVTLDQGIMDVLPPGCRVLSSSPAGVSLWGKTLKIAVQLADGTEKSYFLKSVTGDRGQNMMHGTYESEKSMHSFIPENVPRPVAHGSYKSQPDMHFYLADFVEMNPKKFNQSTWAKTVYSLHRKSMGKSPGGKFGFHVSSYLSDLPINNTWNSSWEKFWTQQVQSLCDEREARWGPDESFTRLKTVFLELVVPRYLRPLESDGRSVKPCLLHNNLWPGNISHIRDSADSLCVFDSASYWGHYEVDLRATYPGLWKMTKGGDEYIKQMGFAEPQAEYPARIELYVTIGKVLRLAMYNTDNHRELCISHMQKQIDKLLLAPTLNNIGDLGVASRSDERDQQLGHLDAGLPIEDAKRAPETVGSLTVVEETDEKSKQYASVLPIGESEAKHQNDDVAVPIEDIEQTHGHVGTVQPMDVIQEPGKEVEKGPDSESEKSIDEEVSEEDEEDEDGKDDQETEEEYDEDDEETEQGHSRGLLTWLGSFVPRYFWRS